MSRLSLFFLLCSLPAVAADLKITVNDPRSLVVADARVALYADDSSTPVAVHNTTPEGIASFTGLSNGIYRAQVLAPGFAEADQQITVSDETSATVTLKVAANPETVSVTATRTPVSTDVSASDLSAVDRPVIEHLQPTYAADVLRFVPGLVINNAGRRGGQASLFVRGGESRYNKVIIDGVTVNDPGGTFDFGVIPMTEVERLELVRGAQSTLYGSDAMTSVVQMWTRVGTTTVPEFRFGADGGTFGTAHGYASVAGARGMFDYNLFGEQVNTEGQGINDAYSNSSQGGNVGLTFSPRVSLRVRARHSNNSEGVQSFWNFNGLPIIPPDEDQHASQNNFLGSVELNITAPSRWQHRFIGFEYHHRRENIDSVQEPGRFTPAFGGFNFDTPFNTYANINRAGFEYEGDYWETSWARTTFGYRFEDENGFIGDRLTPSLIHGLYRNHDLYGQELLAWKRASLILGGRFVHNESFGDRFVPRVAASYMVLGQHGWFSSTRLRASYATGIKEPRLEETFANGPFTIPNPNLKPEENRAVEAGIEQTFFGTKASLSATYFHNLFRNRIDFASVPDTFIGQYVNINRALAHGAEFVMQIRPGYRWNVQGAYVYTSTQTLEAPLAFDPLLAAGQPLLRRPKHSGNLLATYSRTRWGGTLGVSAVGRRTDSDFFGLVPHVDHAAGYERVDAGAWYAINRYMTAYVDVENLLNKRYEEAAGFPALKANFRAGMRFRLGGE